MGQRSSSTVTQHVASALLIQHNHESGAFKQGECENLSHELVDPSQLRRKRAPIRRSSSPNKTTNQRQNIGAPRGELDIERDGFARFRSKRNVKETRALALTTRSGMALISGSVSLTLPFRVDPLPSPGGEAGKLKEQEGFCRIWGSLPLVARARRDPHYGSHLRSLLSTQHFTYAKCWKRGVPDIQSAIPCPAVRTTRLSPSCRRLVCRLVGRP
jgi:hypothetical protein